MSSMPDFYAVGIGASAGGIEALDLLFRSLSRTPKMAFVVVQHLSPDYKSFLADILRRSSEMPVFEAEDGMSILPGHVFVLPPGKTVNLVGAKLKLTVLDRKPTKLSTVDVLFRSLAQNFGSRSIGVVLSGTGSDGSRGLQDVRKAGGAAFIQSVESAKFEGMPHNAISSGESDVVGPPAELAALLSNLSGVAENATAESLQTPAIGEIQRLFRLIKDQYDVDFLSYKTNTLYRRISKHIDRLKVSPNAYVDHLAEHAKELDYLYNDLLIGVTRFFRDPDAFQFLSKEVIPKIFARKKAGELVRVWTPGCASGAEPYSVAMLLLECARENGYKNEIKVFATDIVPEIIRFASAGRYPEEALKLVDPSLVERYFRAAEDGFEVRPELRSRVVFARQNVLKDPPMLKMDLITCRNMLIYFKKAAQIGCLQNFYFSLNKDGYLFLGPSESPAEMKDGFQVLHAKWKIFRKLEGISPPDLAKVRRSRETRLRNLPSQLNGADPASSSAGGLSLPVLEALARRLVRSGLVINENLDLIHTFGNGGEYLSVLAGPAKLNLKNLVPPKALSAIRVALQRTSSGQWQEDRSAWTKENSKEVVFFSVEPIDVDVRAGEERLYVILFHSEPAIASAAKSPEEKGGSGGKSKSKSVQSLLGRVKRLERELEVSQGSLQSTIEELETSNEELQSTNEELLASNEELQSTNEELHSVNEELYTVNTEYQAKIDELTRMTADEDNFLKSTDIGVVYLDSKAQIRKFTRSVTKVLNLMPQDVDRPFEHITHVLDIDLFEEVRKAFSSLTEVTRKVSAKQGKRYFMRIIPYRNQLGEVDGLVITFTDLDLIESAG